MAVLKSPRTLAARPALKRLSASAWTEATKLTAATTAKMSRTMAFAGCGMELHHSILRPRQMPLIKPRGGKLCCTAYVGSWHTASNRCGAKVGTRSERSGHAESVGGGLI